ISEKFCACRNASLFTEKNAPERTSAISGATACAPSTRRAASRTRARRDTGSDAVGSVVAIIVSKTAAGARHSGRRPEEGYPQQSARPYATLFDGTSDIGLSVIRLTPVSVYPETFFPVFA